MTSIFNTFTLLTSALEMFSNALISPDIVALSLGAQVSKA